MARIHLGLLIIGAVGVMATSADMGPAAFMWPADRVWNGEMDNTAPCGSVAGPTNRTRYPIKDGVVALVAQDDSYSVTMSISFQNGSSCLFYFYTLLDQNLPILTRSRSQESV